MIPKFKFGINYFIQEQLSYLDISTDLFLQKLNISKDDFENILDSKEIISRGFADKLSIHFSISSEYWINLDKNYKEWLNK